MANPGSFEYECFICGMVFPYEDMEYLPDDSLVCRDCYEWYMKRQKKGKSGVLWVNEDDGYPD